MSKAATAGVGLLIGGAAVTLAGAKMRSSRLVAADGPADLLDDEDDEF